MEPIWLNQLKRIQALASTSLAYCTDPYERERLLEMLNVCDGMLARHTGLSLSAVLNVAPDQKSYPTPKVDVRAAVLEAGKIMLVRERDNGLWTMPGGFAEIGFSPAENAKKEVLEEAGVIVSVRSLYAVRHKAKGPFLPDVRDFYKMYFLCSRVDETVPAPGTETTEVRFFGVDELPPLCLDRVVPQDVERAVLHASSPVTCWFD